jgi:hypothetical protein
MSALHNLQRYGETWSPVLIAQYLEVLRVIKEFVTISGGWAWHFISPTHIEYKHLHDHKDVDVFVSPIEFLTLIEKLRELGFSRMKTRFDTNNFQRYVQQRLVIDIFLSEVRELRVQRDGEEWFVVEPEYLLSLYKTIHGSKGCVAVVTASELIKKGLKPCKLVNHADLVKLPST